MTRTALLAATILATLAAVSHGAEAQPVTGIYIGAAGGANFLQQEELSYGGRLNFNTGYAALGNIGYGFGNGLRLELEGNYRANRVGKYFTNFSERKYGGMANALFDLDVGSPYIYPYIGGGVGFAETKQDSTYTYSSPDFSFKNVFSGTPTSFAYQAIAGLSFPIPPVIGLSLTAEYRYYALAGSRTFTTNTSPIASGKYSEKQDYNHSLMIGLRYAFNVAPPPAPEQPAAPPPQAEAARTYLVFFDWDRADLTDRARQIVAQAAQASTRVQVTRIEVSGHTDTTGAAPYNQRLSLRRAQVVAAELVHDGVPAAAITTQGFGFSRPLVATGPNVREPQNRRVEIVLK